MKRHDRHFVYILKCRNGTYYTGYTANIDKRIKRHNKGHGAKYLRGRLPVTLAYSKEYRYYKNALKAEKELKKLTHAQKEKLVRAFSADTNN